MKFTFGVLCLHINIKVATFSLKMIDQIIAMDDTYTN